MRVVAYVRVSTDSKDQVNSFQNQKTYFENRLGKLENYTLVGIYSDKGLTGTQLHNRPEFNKMLYDAGIDIIETYTGKDKRLKKKHILYEESDREAKFNEIWIKNTSRFARNTLSYQIVEKLRNKGVHIYFVEQDLNTKDVVKDILLKFFQIFDEQDSRDKSVKVSTGIREGARKGVISTNTRIFGYKYIQHENKLEIIPREAEVIRLIYSLYSQGYGIRRIINQLNERSMYTRDGKSFCKSSINRILSNEKYAGINVRLKYTSGTVFNKYSYPLVKPPEEWILVEPKHKIPAIVSKEIFDQCQEILKGKVNYQNQKGLYKGTTEFASKIVCGKCGKPYTANKDRGKSFYNCQNKKQYGTHVCDNKNIYVKNLDEQITSEKYIMALLSYKMGCIEPLVHLGDYLLERYIGNNNVKQVSELQATLADVKKKRGKLIDLYLESKCDIQDYEERKAPLDTEIDTLEDELAEVSKPLNELKIDIDEIRFAVDQIQAMEIKNNYSRDEILSDIDQIVIDGDNVTVVYKTSLKFRELTAKYDLDNLYNRICPDCTLCVGCEERWSKFQSDDSKMVTALFQGNVS